MNVWILSRFVHGRAGAREPGKAALSLAEAIEARRCASFHLDPLDAWFVAGGADPGFRIEGAAPPEPARAVFLTDPPRPESDARFAAVLESRGVRCVNPSHVLRILSEPFSALDALSRAGISVEPSARVRRPHPVDDVVSEFGLPLEVVLPLAESNSAIMTVGDRGSLRGILDHLWRSDEPALLRRSRSPSEPQTGVAVVVGAEFSDAGGLASRAAAALGLDFGWFTVRGEGRAARVCSVSPYPAPWSRAPSKAVLDEMARLATA